MPRVRPASWRMVALAAAACLASGAAAQEQPPLLPTDAPLHMRDPTMVERFYPEIAQRLDLEGRASALCRVTPAGDLMDCVVPSEEPAGFGFAQALLRMASMMQVPSRAKDGSPTAGRQYLLNVGFKLPKVRPVRRPSLPKAKAADVVLARQLPYLAALAATIETELQPSIEHIKPPASQVPMAVSASSLMQGAVVTKHADLLEALAVAHAATMAGAELQAGIKAPAPVGERSPEMTKKAQTVVSLVVPWYRDQVFAEMRRNLAATQRHP